MTTPHHTALTAPESHVLAERFRRLSADDAATILRMVAPHADPDAVLSLGEDRARSAYFDEIRRLARSYERVAARAIIVGGDESGACEAADTWLHETIDGHQMVIYTYAAMDVLRWSDHDSAATDEYGIESAVDGKVDGIAWSRLAYCAMGADVREHATSPSGIADSVASERDELRDGIVAALQDIVDARESGTTLDYIRGAGEPDATTVDIDVRLQLHVSTSGDLPVAGGSYLAFRIRDGDAAYDADHSGWWGAGSITWDIEPGDEPGPYVTYSLDTDIDELADDLLDQALDHFESSTTEEGDS